MYVPSTIDSSSSTLANPNNCYSSTPCSQIIAASVRIPSHLQLTSPQPTNATQTAKYRDSNGAIQTISDHGFRVDLEDPLFDAPINWPKQDYGRNPAGIGANDMPTSVDSVDYLRKRAEEMTATCAEPVPPYPSIED